MWHTHTHTHAQIYLQVSPLTFRMEWLTKKYKENQIFQINIMWVVYNHYLHSGNDFSYTLYSHFLCIDSSSAHKWSLKIFGFIIIIIEKKRKQITIIVVLAFFYCLWWWSTNNATSLLFSLVLSRVLVHTVLTYWLGRPKKKIIKNQTQKPTRKALSLSFCFKSVNGHCYHSHH